MSLSLGMVIVDVLFRGLWKMLKYMPKAVMAVSRLIRRTVAAASRIWLVLWAGSLWLTGAASAMSLAAKFAALAGELSLGELGGAVGWTASAHDLLDFLSLGALHLFHSVTVS